LPTPGSPISTDCSWCGAVDLDHAPDLVVAADHRIEFSEAGALGQVEGVFVQRLALSFGFLALYTLPASHRLDRLLEGFLVDAVTPEQLADLALVLRQCEKQQFRCDELVAALLGFLVGHIQQIGQFPGHADFAFLALDLRQSADRVAQSRLQGRHVGPSTCKKRGRSAVILLQQSRSRCCAQCKGCPGLRPCFAHRRRLVGTGW